MSKRLDYRYQYNDDDLLRLLEEVRKMSCKENFVMFNNMAMREDATRFKGLVKDGFIPSFEGKSLEDRLRIVLKGIKFPIKAREFSNRRGYLLVRVNKKTFNLAEIIKMIGSKEFDSFDELLNLTKAGLLEKQKN